MCINCINLASPLDKLIPFILDGELRYYCNSYKSNYLRQLLNSLNKDQLRKTLLLQKIITNYFLHSLFNQTPFITNPSMFKCPIKDKHFSMLETEMIYLIQFYLPKDCGMNWKLMFSTKRDSHSYFIILLS